MTIQWLIYLNFLIDNNTRFLYQKSKTNILFEAFLMICNEFYTFKSLKVSLLVYTRLKMVQSCYATKIRMVR